MTLTNTACQPEGTVENPFQIVNGPDRMDLMMALFEGKELYFALGHRRDKTPIHIWSLRKFYSDGTYWGIEGTIPNPDDPLNATKFTAQYLMRGGERTGTLYYS